MEIDFSSEFKGYSTYKSKFQIILKRALKMLKMNIEPIISVSIVSNEFIHSLNRQYRNIDRPTDVISFAFLDGVSNKDSILKSKEVVALGDIYISLDKAIEQAKEYGHSLDRELKFLFLHGTLHLLGFDHIEKDDEKIMFDWQDKILPKE